MRYIAIAFKRYGVRRHSVRTMRKITKFEDIEAWQDARVIAKTVYSITEKWKDFALRDQIRRAAISIMANIAEGYARGGNKEFIQFMFIAKASASELQSHLYLSLDLNYIPQEDFLLMYEHLDKVQRKLSVFIRVLRNNATTL